MQIPTVEQLETTKKLAINAVTQAAGLVYSCQKAMDEQQPIQTRFYSRQADGHFHMLHKQISENLSPFQHIDQFLEMEAAPTDLVYVGSRGWATYHEAARAYANEVWAESAICFSKAIRSGEIILTNGTYPQGTVKDRIPLVAEKLKVFDPYQGYNLAQQVKIESGKAIKALMFMGELSFDTTKKTTTKKNREKSQRRMTVEAADCIRRFKKELKRDPSVKMTDIVEAYVAETGKSTVEGLMRRLSDLSGEWKPDTNTT